MKEQVETQIKNLEASANVVDQALNTAALKGTFDLKNSTVVNQAWENLKAFLVSTLNQAAEEHGIGKDEPAKATEEVPVMEAANVEG
jgi:hypothetical protein